MIPTVGFNMRKVTKGNVTIKVGLSFITVVINSPTFLIATSVDMGYRRAASFPEYVGEVLQGSTSYPVSSYVTNWLLARLLVSSYSVQ